MLRAPRAEARIARPRLATSSWRGPPVIRPTGGASTAKASLSAPRWRRRNTSGVGAHAEWLSLSQRGTAVEAAPRIMEALAQSRAGARSEFVAHHAHSDLWGYEGLCLGTESFAALGADLQHVVALKCKSDEIELHDT